MKFFRLLVLMALVFGAGVLTLAQDDEDDGIDLTLYADIPQSRADDGAFILGDPDAPVTVIEFADYLCPHCQDYHATVSEFIDEYVATGQAKLEYRFFPIIDPQLSPYLASLTECTWDKKAFWPTYELIYELARARAIDGGILDVVAEATAISADDLTACVETAAQYEEDVAFGRELDVSGTPAIRVRVGDGPAGAITVDGRTLTSGGVPFEVLADFVESDDPESMVTYELGPQLLNADLLPDMSLITEDPCGPPCWNGITPGETTWAAALEILEADEALRDVEVQGDGTGRVGAAWGVVDGDLCCQMFSDESGDVVAFVILQIAPELTFEEVIDVHGEPEFLTGEVMARSQAIASVFYPDLPMLVYVFVAGAEGEIKGASSVLGMAYLTEDLYAELIASSPDLIEWDGFGTFSAYFLSDEDESA